MKKLFLLSFLCISPLYLNASLNPQESYDPCERSEYYMARANLASNTPAQFEELYAKKLLYSAECREKKEKLLKELEAKIFDEIKAEQYRNYLMSGGAIAAGLVASFLLYNPEK